MNFFVYHAVLILGFNMLFLIDKRQNITYNKSETNLVFFILNSLNIEKLVNLNDLLIKEAGKGNPLDLVFVKKPLKPTIALKSPTSLALDKNVKLITNFYPKKILKIKT